MLVLVKRRASDSTTGRTIIARMMATTAQASTRVPALPAGTPWVAVARGFTQFSYAFVQFDGDRIAEQQPAQAKEIWARSTRLFLRARDYGLEGLKLQRGITAAQLRGADREQALVALKAEDTDLL